MPKPSVPKYHLDDVLTVKIRLGNDFNIQVTNSPASFIDTNLSGHIEARGEKLFAKINARVFGGTSKFDGEFKLGQIYTTSPDLTHVFIWPTIFALTTNAVWEPGTNWVLGNNK
jgi:hypothetical protein